MPQLITKHPLTGIPPEQFPELRRRMAENIGGSLIKLMLDDIEYLTGATIRVEHDTIFVGATETEMGEPFMQIKVDIDARGNNYLQNKQPLKVLT